VRYDQIVSSRSYRLPRSKIGNMRCQAVRINRHILPKQVDHNPTHIYRFNFDFGIQSHQPRRESPIPVTKNQRALAMLKL